MNDLMELIKSCEVADSAKALNYKALDLAGELGKLGFEKMAKKLGREFIVSEKMECIAKEKYPVVTDEKVQAFLDALAKEYNAKRKKKTVTLRPGGTLFSSNSIDDFLTQTYTATSAAMLNQIYSQFSTGVAVPQDTKTLSATTCDAMSNAPGTVGCYKWKEVKIAEYDGIPPAPALAALAAAQAKEIFDYYTIASVSAVKDPLLLGRIEGRPERWFLSQWGDDVCLDDVI